MFRNFQEIKSEVKTGKMENLPTIVLVNATDETSIQTAIVVKKEYGINSILVGDQNKIRDLLAKENAMELDFTIVDAKTPLEASKTAVKLIHSGDANFIMKGNIQTGDLIRPVLDKESGLKANDILTIVALLDIPNHNKLLGVTDGGLLLNPTFKEKISIIQNSVTLFHQLGYKRPKVGIIEANEIVNPRVPSSLEAEKLMELQQQNKDIFGECVVDGPISTDVALDPYAAKAKNYDSEVAGDADIFVGPNITVANAFTKALLTFADAEVAAFVVGAQCPIITNSRASSVKEKVNSVVIATRMYYGG